MEYTHCCGLDSSDFLRCRLSFWPIRLSGLSVPLKTPVSLAFTSGEEDVTLASHFFSDKWIGGNIGGEFNTPAAPCHRRLKLKAFANVPTP